MSKKDGSFTAVVIETSKNEGVRVTKTDKELISELDNKLENFRSIFATGGGTASAISSAALAVFVAYQKGISFELCYSVFTGLVTIFGGYAGYQVANEVAKVAAGKRKQSFNDENDEKTKVVLAADMSEAAFREKWLSIVKEYKPQVQQDPGSMPSLFADLSLETKDSNEFTRKVLSDLKLNKIEVSHADRKRIRILGMKWEKFNLNIVKSSSDISAFATAIHHVYVIGTGPKILSSIYAALATLHSPDLSKQISSIVQGRMSKLKEEEISDPNVGRKSKYDPKMFGGTSGSDTDSSYTSSSTSSFGT